MSKCTLKEFKLLNCGHRHTRQIPSRPGCLKVEPAGNGIYVQYFSGQKKSGANPAFEGIEIDFFERNATRGYEFILVGALSGDLKTGLCELFIQLLTRYFIEVGPALLHIYTACFCQALPQARGHTLLCVRGYGLFPAVLPVISKPCIK